MGVNTQEKMTDFKLPADTRNSEQIDHSLVECIRGFLEARNERNTNSQHQSQDNGNGSLVLGTNVMRQFSEGNTSWKSKHTFATKCSQILY